MTGLKTPHWLRGRLPQLTFSHHLLPPAGQTPGQGSLIAPSLGHLLSVGCVPSCPLGTMEGPEDQAQPRESQVWLAAGCSEMF